MARYLLKRLLLIPPMMLGITLVSFMMILCAPGVNGSGDEGGAESVNRLGKEQLELLRKEFHIGEPVYVRYWYWVSGVLHGDFGHSVTRQTLKVSDRIAEALPVTLLLNLISITVIYLVALPLGIFSAVRKDTLSERALSIFLFGLYALPSFWVAIMLIKLMVMLKVAGWPSLPIQQLWPDHADKLPTVVLLWECLQRLFLPVLAMSYAGLAGISRYMRAGLLDVIRADYIRTARAKGCSEGRTIFKHALRNALIPVITLLAGLLPGLIGGSFIIETIFGIPGMGYLSYTAVLERDYTVLMATLTCSAFLTLFGILLSDILYSLVDPRITFEKK